MAQVLTIPMFIEEGGAILNEIAGGQEGSRFD
jgi:hypothetical protein